MGTVLRDFADLCAPTATLLARADVTASAFQADRDMEPGHEKCPIEGLVPFRSCMITRGCAGHGDRRISWRSAFTLSWTRPRV
jgi:hypothetical protein